MKTLEEVDLAQATQAYAVANTPLFLVRKLNIDPVVQEIARSFTADQILADLQKIMSRGPENTADYVRPYVYLVALSSTENGGSALEQAQRVPNKDKWEWFSYINHALNEAYTPTINQTLTIPPQATVDTTRTDAAVEWNKIALHKAG